MKTIKCLNEKFAGLDNGGEYAFFGDFLFACHGGKEKGQRFERDKNKNQSRRSFKLFLLESLRSKITLYSVIAKENDTIHILIDSL